MTTGIYLLHFLPSYKHAKHYLGYADDIEPRIYAHLHGRGARLTQVAGDAGCTLLLVRVWEGADRKTERRFKNRSHVPALCPICRGDPVQMPLMPWMPAYVPQPEPAIQDAATDNDWPRDAADFWQLAEADDLADDMLDRDFWARGSW